MERPWKLLLVFVSWWLANTCCGKESTVMLPFGEGAGDTCIPVLPGDINTVNLNNPIHAFGTDYSSVNITFIGLVQIGPVVSASLLLDIVFGFILFREATDITDFKAVNTIMNSLYPDLTPYHASSAFIITWVMFPLDPLTNPAQSPVITQTVFVNSMTVPAVLYLYGNTTYPDPASTVVGITDGVNERFYCGDGVIFESIDVSLLTELSLTPQSCPGVFGFTLPPDIGGTCIPFVTPDVACDSCLPTVAEDTTCSGISYSGCPRKTQDERLFASACDNCIVSDGIGFNSDHEDCSCFFVCTSGVPYKLGPPSRPWVLHKRCCPCHQSFSIKLLTCVDYTDKRSDCFAHLDNNGCNDAPAGSLLPRTNPDVAALGSQLCSGFINCETVGDRVVPRPSCCPAGQCFDVAGMTCSTAACSTGYCGTLRQTDDCECDVTQTPQSECPFLFDPSDVTRFMGVQNMRSYQCAAGTCWDQEHCTCVRTNNTGYNMCEPFAALDFTTDVNARDNLGNRIYASGRGQLEVTGGAAVFTAGQINVMGLAKTYLSNDYVLHFKFTLLEDDSSSMDETQCIVGNCLRMTPGLPLGGDSLAVTVDRGGDSSGTGIDVFLTYQDKHYMSSADSMETTTIEITANLQLDTMYDFWLIYCGSEGYVISGVLDGSQTVVGVATDDVTGSVQLIHDQSGFLFGSCLSGNNYEGQLDDIEMWRDCKPFSDGAFTTAFDTLTGATG